MRADITYDADGNQLTGGNTATYDNKGRLATLGGASLTHLSSSNAELTGLGTSVYRNTLLGVGYIDVGGNISRLQRSPDDGSAVSQTRDSARRWFVTDHLGSTIALASSTGTIERRYDYTIVGEDTTTGNGPTTWIRYAGGHDIGNGLYHFGARYVASAATHPRIADSSTPSSQISTVPAMTFPLGVTAAAFGVGDEATDQPFPAAVAASARGS